VARLQANAPGIQKVSHRSDRLAAAPALAAYGENQIAEGVIAKGNFEGLFHGREGDWILSASAA
jgi:hypothetical protein